MYYVKELKAKGTYSVKWTLFGILGVTIERFTSEHKGLNKCHAIRLCNKLNKKK